MAQVGSAPRLGRGGWTFKSSCPDQWFLRSLAGCIGVIYKRSMGEIWKRWRAASSARLWRAPLAPARDLGCDWRSTLTPLLPRARHPTGAAAFPFSACGVAWATSAPRTGDITGSNPAAPTSSAGSSNGRTPDSESGRRGSNPRLAANRPIVQTAARTAPNRVVGVQISLGLPASSPVAGNRTHAESPADQPCNAVIAAGEH